MFPNRGEQQDALPAHKFILSMRSPVFEEMFYGLDAGKQETEITVRDIRPTTFRALLK